jgi:hypothetical protein
MRLENRLFGMIEDMQCKGMSIELNQLGIDEVPKKKVQGLFSNQDSRSLFCSKPINVDKLDKEGMYGAEGHYKEQCGWFFF